MAVKLTGQAHCCVLLCLEDVQKRLAEAGSVFGLSSVSVGCLHDGVIWERYISQIQLCLATGISVCVQSRLDASPQAGGVHGGCVCPVKFLISSAESTE